MVELAELRTIQDLRVIIGTNSYPCQGVFVEVNERFRAIREFKGWTRAELAQLSGLPQDSWRNMEQGKVRANEDHFQAIGKLCPEFVFWLVTGMTDAKNGQISPALLEEATKPDTQAKRA
ncbi:helix-turn-helix domain-containing protein [Leeia sp.]|uniref:helix-turn-helix domain-containing protein n=1 Tax=Leeia sp. TaxID=2884678 RepID=UPI0035B2A2BB